MKKRYQVFISSTFQDLQPARQEVSQALLRSDCFPAGMELFPAADEEQFAYIKEIIDESDYYIIISAGRYGSIDAKTGLSYTEMEYDYALKREKPIIRLLHVDPLNHLRGEFIEKTDAAKIKLEAFRNKLKEGRLVRFWKEPEELGAEVIHGINDAKRRKPAQGWIRAKSASPAYDELRDSIINMGNALRTGTDVYMDRFPYPVFRVNQFGEVAYVNTVGRKVFNNYLEVGYKIEDLFEGLEKPILNIFSNIKSTDNPRVKVRAIVNGEEKHFEISFSKIDDLDNSILAVLNDLTGFKELENQFVQSQKMQAVGQLAGGIAHDFNNLLTAIIGHCDLLLLSNEKNSPNFNDLMNIKNNAYRGASLVRHLLAFSRKQTLRPELLDIGDLLAELSVLLDRLVGEKVTVSLENDPNLSYVRADMVQLEQVIINLVLNSRDAMPDGGTIKIVTETKEYELPQERGSASIPAGRYVRLTVMDEGCGILPKNVDKVFEPFFTTKGPGEGTGLGLSTVYGIIKQTGGYIFLESTVDVGTKFEIILPEFSKELEIDQNKLLKPNEVENKNPFGIEEDAEKEGDIRSFGTVIYAEDEDDIRSFTVRSLQLRGFTVIDANCGEGALKLLREFEGSVDAFLTDVIMPGTDGPAWVKQALKLRPNTPTLFVSGYAKESFWDRIKEIPNFRFLPKPYSISEISQELASLIVASAGLRSDL